MYIIFFLYNFLYWTRYTFGSYWYFFVKFWLHTFWNILKKRRIFKCFILRSEFSKIFDKFHVRYRNTKFNRAFDWFCKFTIKYKQYLFKKINLVMVNFFFPQVLWEIKKFFKELELKTAEETKNVKSGFVKANVQDNIDQVSFWS